MSYSIKQAIELANKIEYKYGDKKITKSANTQAILTLMQNYEGTADFLGDVAQADMEMWKELIESGSPDEGNDHNDFIAAAKHSYKIITDASNAIRQIESKFL
jgi:hypothetical protein